MAHPNESKKETVAFRGLNRDEEGRRVVEMEKVEVFGTHNLDTLKHIEKKLIDKGIQRKDRRPADGRPRGLQHKSGHGGKYTWEGPSGIPSDELESAPSALDENDPNYVDEEAERRILRVEDSGVAGLVIGEVAVAKMAEEGVARIDVDPKLNVDV